MTPDEFTSKMLEIVGKPPDFQFPATGNRRELNTLLGDNYSPDTAHSEADELIISFLESLGYSTGARIFQAMTKWYS